jgi:hypothetical protein
MKNTAVIWVVVVVLSIVSLIARTPAQTLQSVNGFTVVDAAGKTVGRTLGIEETGRVSVGFTVDGHSFAIRVDQNRFAFKGSDDRLFFESGDCSGTPFIFSDNYNPLPEVVITPPGSTVYISDSSVAPPDVTVGSCRSSDGMCNTQCGSLGPGRLTPAMKLIDLQTQFTPPFRAVPSSLVCGDCDGDGAVTANEITRVISNVFGESAPQ